MPKPIFLFVCLCLAATAWTPAQEPAATEPTQTLEEVDDRRASTAAEIQGIWHWDIDRMLEAGKRSDTPDPPEVQKAVREGMHQAFGQARVVIGADTFELYVGDNLLEKRIYRYADGQIHAHHPDRGPTHRSARVMTAERVGKWLVITGPGGVNTMWLLPGPPPPPAPVPAPEP
jgi:hypothetical protein